MAAQYTRPVFEPRSLCHKQFILLIAISVALDLPITETGALLSNNLKAGEDELFILKRSNEESKIKYLNEATKEFTQTSDNISLYNGTKNSEGDNSEKDVLENVEKDKKENANKCVKNQSDTDVQVVAKILQTDCTNKG
uniref:Uncharacterized protein n=1 Tax=Timema genevievae TaxID=629358 RepID=A0A7R9JZU0_TIMGE|nr:unnamed protein product [Timema genevievae]